MKMMPELVATNGRTLAADHPESPLAIAGLTVSYGEKPVLFSVDHVTPPGAMLAVIGPKRGRQVDAHQGRARHCAPRLGRGDGVRSIL